MNIKKYDSDLHSVCELLLVYLACFFKVPITSLFMFMLNCNHSHRMRLFSSKHHWKTGCEPHHTADSDYLANMEHLASN